jgi:hypothetical protein
MISTPFWRSFKNAAWLGWQIESNWTDPFLFDLLIVKPISSADPVVMTASHRRLRKSRSFLHLSGNAFISMLGR